MSELELDVELLIEQVRLYPELWDSHCVKYQHRLAKVAAWASICVKLSPNFEQKSEIEKRSFEKFVKSKWRHLRDNFMRSHKKLNPNDDTQKTYIFTKKLRFLVCAKTPAPTDPNSLEMNAGNDEQQSSSSELTSSDVVQTANFRRLTIERPLPTFSDTLSQNLQGNQREINGTQSPSQNPQGTQREINGTQSRSQNPQGTQSGINGTQSLAKNFQGNEIEIIDTQSLSQIPQVNLRESIGTQALSADLQGNQREINGTQSLSQNPQGNQRDRNGTQSLSQIPEVNLRELVGTQPVYQDLQGNQRDRNGTQSLSQIPQVNLRELIGTQPVYQDLQGNQRDRNGTQSLSQIHQVNLRELIGTQPLYQDLHGNQREINGTQSLSQNPQGNQRDRNGTQSFMDSIVPMVERFSENNQLHFRCELLNLISTIRAHEEEAYIRSLQFSYNQLKPLMYTRHWYGHPYHPLTIRDPRQSGTTSCPLTSYHATSLVQHRPSYPEVSQYGAFLIPSRNLQSTHSIHFDSQPRIRRQVDGNGDGTLEIGDDDVFRQYF